MKSLKLEERILEKVSKAEKGISLLELDEIEGFKGNRAFGYVDMNIWIWFSLSQEAIDSLNDLMRRDKIWLQRSSALPYIEKGYIPKLKIARGIKLYKNPRWLPVIINLVGV